MSFVTLQTAIENKFATGFTSYPIKWQNVNFNSDAHDIFVDFQIAEGETIRASIGTHPLARTVGVISANIYLRQNVGTVVGRTIADQIAAIFRDSQFSGVTCMMPTVRNLGAHEGRYIVNVSTQFHYDKQH